MSTVKDILDTKGSHVYTISKDANVLDAATVMNDNSIGALVVVDDGRVSGIFTERDVLRRVVAVRQNPSEVSIEKVMTAPVACCLVNTTIKEAQTVFKNHRIRHLPVVDAEQRMIGMISIGDLNAYQANEQQSTIRFLHEYLYGST